MLRFQLKVYRMGRKFCFKYKNDVYLLKHVLPTVPEQDNVDILATETQYVANPFKNNFVFAVTKLPIKHNKDVILFVDKTEFSRICEEKKGCTVEKTDKDIVWDVTHCGRIITDVKFEY